MSTLVGICSNSKKMSKKICTYLMLFVHFLQSIIGIFHVIIVLRLTLFVWSNIDLFCGNVWSIMIMYILAPFAICALIIIYVQVSLLRSTQKERTTGMSVDEYKKQVYSGTLVVFISVTCFYLHINNQSRFDAFLLKDLKRMISQYNNSSRSALIINQIQTRHNCCGSHDLTDWIEGWNQRDSTLKRSKESATFPNSCCVDDICGVKPFLSKITDDTRKISLRSQVKLNGCLGVLKTKMAAIWLKNSFLLFLLPVINELMFIIMMFTSRILRNSISSSNLEFANESVILDDEIGDMVVNSSHNMVVNSSHNNKVDLEPSDVTNDGSINNNVVNHDLLLVVSSDDLNKNCP